MRKQLLLAGSAIVTAVAASVAWPVAASAATPIVVHDGQSIQAAVDKASPGTTILIKPGTYHETGRPCPTEPSVTCAVVIGIDGISLVAQPKPGKPVVLENPGGQDMGVAFAKTAEPSCLTDVSQRIQGALVQNLTVHGFEGIGILLFCVDDWRVTGVQADGNGEYGIFPSHVGTGRVDRSEASGANDTGIYVGQSHDVRVDHDTASHNVSGFEIENSTGVRLDHNRAEHNTGGILSFVLPFLDVNTNTDNEIDHNVVTFNNKPNTCEDPEDAVCHVPAGTGILIVSADSNSVHHNRATWNDSIGIGVGNLCLQLRLSPEQCAGLGIEPNPDDNRITNNTARANGLHPDPVLSPLPGADLLWDTTGTGDCWANNKADTQFPDPLPAC